MVERIRYQVGGDNSILKLALYDTYRTKCYWCGKPQRDYGSVQIDHIIPQKIEPADITKWVGAERASGYDLHAPYNLAPICPRCNGKKSNRDFSLVPAVETALRDALQLQPEVIRRVNFFEEPSNIAKTLMTIATMDFRNSDNRAMFEEHMPALVRRLAAIDPAKAHDFEELRTIEVGDPTCGQPNLIFVTLGVLSRRKVTILEDVCGVTLEKAMQFPMVSLIEEVTSEAERALRAHEFEDRHGEPDVSTPDGDIDINVDTIELTRDDSYFWFTFAGTVDASVAGFLAVSSFDAETTDYIQGDVFIRGHFSVGAGWELGDPQCVEAIVDRVGRWEIDTDIH